MAEAFLERASMSDDEDPSTDDEYAALTAMLAGMSDDEDEPEPEETDDADDLSAPEQLTGRVPRIHRPPVRYNPSAGSAAHCVLKLDYHDSLYFESEMDTGLELLECELSDLDLIAAPHC